MPEHNQRPTVLRPVEHYVATWFHTVPSGYSLEDVQRPDFWSHVAARLRPHHRIVVDCEDGSWTATLFVRSVSRLSAVVGVISHTDLAGPIEHASVAALEPDYEITWGGPAHKFRVIRKSDGGVLKTGFDTRELAAQWVRNHMRAAA